MGTRLVFTLVAVLVSIVAAGGQDEPAPQDCALRDAVNFVRGVYLEPFKLADVEIMARTRWFRPTSSTADLELRVRKYDPCCEEKRADLLSVRVRFRDGRLIGVHASSGPGFHPSASGVEVRKKRIADTLSILTRMMASRGIASTAEDENRGIERVVLQDQGGIPDPTTGVFVFSLDTGFLRFGGAP